jgi:hypothetical protein
VGFNGGGAEVQVLGDLGVGQAGGDQGEDFPLAACGAGEVPGDWLGGLRAVGELGDGLVIGDEDPDGRAHQAPA